MSKSKRNASIIDFESTIRDELGNVSGYAIESVSTGLYDDVRHVIREYVQNSFDAIKDQFQASSGQGKVEITLDKKRDTISLLDNGTGMTLRELISGINIGYSRKGSEDVGFRGIGMMAGWALANKIVVVTKTSDESNILQAEIKCKEVRDFLDRARINGDATTVKDIFSQYVSIRNVEAPAYPVFSEGHGTLVVLEKISGSRSKFFGQGELVSYLSEVVPVPFRNGFSEAPDIEREIIKHVNHYRTVELTVNKHPVAKIYEEDDDFKDKPRYELIRARDGSTLAFIWYQIRYKSSNKPQKGLRLRVMGFTVGDAGYVQENLITLSGSLWKWVRGEIFILDKYVLPTSDRNRLKDNDARDQLVFEMRKFQKKLEKEVRNRSAVVGAEKGVAYANETISEISAELEHMKKIPTSAAKKIRKQIKDSKKELTKQKKKLEKDKDHIVKQIGLDKSMSRLSKLEKEIAEKAVDDDKLLDLDKDTKRIFRRMQAVIESFEFQSYCTKKGQGNLAELRADLIAAIGRRLTGKR